LGHWGFVAAPDAFAQFTASEIPPDVLDRVEYWRVAWQALQSDVVWDGETCTGLVPTGAVANQHGVGSGGDLAADLRQVLGHDLAVDRWHDLLTIDIATYPGGGPA
jgi:hypothetical protein